MNEIWKNIKDYDGYQVSNMGRIKSLKRRFIKKDKILKLHKHRLGYFLIGLRKNNRTYEILVHRLVLNAFVGESNLVCNHKNNIPGDNRLENLEWVTQSENMKYAFKIGSKISMKGECNGQSKLTDNQVRMIKYIKKNEKVKYGFWQKLAKELNVSKSCIYSISKNRWKHIVV